MPSILIAITFGIISPLNDNSPDKKGLIFVNVVTILNANFINDNVTSAFFDNVPCTQGTVPCVIRITPFTTLIVSYVNINVN